MAISPLQARDPRERKERCGQGKHWEMRKLSAGGEVSAESAGHDMRPTEVAPFANPRHGIHRIELRR